MVTQQTLVDVLAVAIFVPPKSFRAGDRVARQTILEEFQTVRTSTFVAAQSVDALVGAVVFILSALVEILTSFAIVLEDIAIGTTAFVSVVYPVANMGAIGEIARIDGDA